MLNRKIPRLENQSGYACIQGFSKVCWLVNGSMVLPFS